MPFYKTLRIALYGKLSRSYGTSSAIWNHTVLWCFTLSAT